MYDLDYEIGGCYLMSGYHSGKTKTNKIYLKEENYNITFKEEWKGIYKRSKYNTWSQLYSERIYWAG